MSEIEIPRELRERIILWRMAFRRGDEVTRRQTASEIDDLLRDGDPQLRFAVDNLIWADENDPPPLLSPGPLASLREAVAKGWAFQIFWVDYPEPGHFAASLQHGDAYYEENGSTRDEAFRAVLTRANIDF